MPVTQEYKCPSCGGSVEFNPQLQKIKCPWCDTEFDIDVFGTAPECDEPDSMEWDLKTHAKWEDSDADGICSWICESCGGEIITDENTVATFCPWCGSPVIENGRVHGELKPDLIIPFKLNKKQAQDALKKHISSKKLVPPLFRDENRITNIKGVYVPFWIYDTTAKANISYKATKTRVWCDSRYNYTETSHYRVVRGGDISFENIPVDGSSKLDNDITESIEPFIISEARDFSTAYLPGFLADKYDVDSKECETRANERVKTSTENAFRATVTGYSSVQTESSSIKLENARARYTLFPVWLLNTVWQGNTYTFAMNGQTGKFVGDLPLDRKAWWRWFLGVSAVSSAIAFLLSLILFIW